MDATVVGILVAVLVVLIASVLLYYRWRSSSYTSSTPIATSHDRVLIYGPCGAGKTLLFYQLSHGCNQQTQSSMQENVAVFAPKHAASKKQYEFVDLCGHPSQQYRLRRYCTNITHVIFMIDSSDLQNIRNASKMLFNLLSLKAFVAIRPAPKILVACNKTDQPNADSIKGIQTALIKELNKLHGSAETLASVNDTTDEEQAVDIIKEATAVNATKGFSWSDLKCNIDFAACSVIQKKIDAIMTFIDA